MTAAYEIGPQITSRYPRAEVQRRLRAVDLVAVDIDECVFPGFSQSVLGLDIFFDIALRPERPADRARLPQLVRGGLYIRRVSLLRRLGRRFTNEELMARYEDSMARIPEAYFLRGARRIPPRAYAGALETLRHLARHAPLGFISFGVHLITDEFVRQLGQGRPGAVAFAHANVVRFADRGDGVPRFAGYRRPLLTRPAQKLALLEQERARLAAARPLVIGNGRDEAEMAQAARALGGLSIGFRPPPDEAAPFDLLVRAPDWRPLRALLRGLLP